MINLCPSVDVPYITNLLLVIDQFARKMSNSSFYVHTTSQDALKLKTVRCYIILVGRHCNFSGKGRVLQVLIVSPNIIA
jgi:hypothetical protein